MIKSRFDIGEVAKAVGMWIPGFRFDGGDASVPEGEKVSYRLRCTRNELIEDFDVDVTVLSGGEADVKIRSEDGGSVTVRMPVGSDGVLGPIEGTKVPVAVEGLPTDGGVREYTVHLFRGRRSGMAWVYDSFCKEDFCSTWKIEEALARKQKLGLWKDEKPTPPWEWRSAHRR